MASQTFTNTAPGARGIRTKSGELIMLEPGESRKIDDVPDVELKAAKEAGEIVVGKAAAERAAKEAEQDDEDKA